MDCALCTEEHERGPASRLKLLRARNEELGLAGLRGQNLLRRARGIRLRMAAQKEEAERPKTTLRGPARREPGANRWQVGAARRLGIPLAEYLAHVQAGERRCSACGAWGRWTSTYCPPHKTEYEQNYRRKQVPASSRLTVRRKGAARRRQI